MVNTMGNKMEIQALVEGGKASGGPPIGPAIGPTGVPIKSVVDKINEETKDFKGLKVPVTIIVDTENKTFEIKISTPMASALILKEINIPKGSGNTKETKVGDISFEGITKVAKMKRASLNALTIKTAVKILLGTAVSMGVTVEGKDPKEVQKQIDQGEYDEQLKE